MAEYKIPSVIRGEGGGGKGGGSSRVAQEDPNTLRSKNVANVIDLIGEGPIYGLVDGLRSVYLDGVPVQNNDNSFNYNGLTLMTRQGYPDQTALPGMSNVQTEFPVSKEVRNDAPITEGFVNAEADVVNVKVQVQSLTFQEKDTGDLKGSLVAFAIDIRDGDDATWQKMVHKTLKGKTTSPYQTQFKIRLPSGGGPNWQVRVRRLTPDDQGTNISNDLYFVSMTAIIEAKLTYPNSALIGFRADASQFGTSIPERAYLIRGLIINVPSNYNPITREYTGTWNGTFKKAWTNNPAWILYDLVTNTRYGAKQKQFDKWGLYAIGQYCDEMVPDGYGGMEPRFTCNAAITAQEDAYAAIDSMASVFRGMIYWSSSEISAVADRPGTSKVTFTRANIVDDFVRQGTSMKARHSVVLVTWNDPEDEYQKTIEMVTDQEMIEKWGWRQTEITAFGCTSRGQARRAGKWIMYSEKYETETVSFAGTSDAMVLRPGDIITISDPAVSGVRLGGRLKETGTSTLTLDRIDGINTDDDWSITVTMPDGSSETREILSFEGNTVTLDYVLQEAPVNGAVWTLSSSDVQPELFKVISLSDPGVEMQPKITAVSHNPGKYALVEEDIPLPERPVSLLPTGRISPPSNLTAVEHTYLEGSRKAQGIVVSWTPSEDPRVLSYRLEAIASGEYDWKEVYSGAGVEHTIKNSSAGEWSFRVCGMAALGATSVWVYRVEQVTNKLMPTPPTSVVFDPGTLKMGINPQGDMINQMWEVRRSDVPLSLGDVESNSALVGIGTSFVDNELRPLQTYYYYVRGTNTFGVSDWYATQATTKADADAYLEMLNGELRLTELHEDLQTEIGKISGIGEGSVTDRINTVNERLTGVYEELESNDSGFANDLDRIQNTVDGIQQSASEESDRLDEAVQAVADSLTQVETRLDGRADSLSDDIDAVVQSLSEEADRLDQDIADVVQAADDVRTNLEGEVERVETLVTGIEQTASNARDQLAQTDAQLQARVDAADQAIFEEVVNREVEDSVLTQSIFSLTAEVGEGQARLTSLERVTAEAKELEAIQFTAIEVAKASSQASIRTEETARVDGDSALAQTITQLTARVGSAEADITTVDQARVDGESALSSRIGELSAKLDATPQFSSGFEPGTDFDQWAVPANNTLTAETSDIYLGSQSALITCTSSNLTISGATGGVRASIPSGASQAFEGYEVVVTAAIKKPATNASLSMAIGYSTNGAGTSNWQPFTPTDSWTTVEFRYTVPEGAGSTNDYIGIWGDVSGNGRGVLVDSVNIRRASAEISEITSAIQAEQQARVSADAAMASDITALTTNFQGVDAGLTQEQQVRANADSAMASDITSLQTGLGDANAAITSEAATRLSKDNALATRASNLEARMGSAESNISSEENARVSADEALTSQISSANSRIDDAESSITTEAQTRASQDEALSDSIEALLSSVGDVESSVTQEAQARATADSALASRAASLETRMGDAESGITSEQTARISADNALSSSISELSARLDDSGGTVVDEARVRAEEDSILSQALLGVTANLGEAQGSINSLSRVQAERDFMEAIQFSSLEASKATSHAAIRTEEQVRVTETTALASRATSLEARVGDAESNITSEASARASADSALTSSINTQKSRIDSANAAISSEASTRATETEALTNGLQSANSRIDDAESSITTEAQTRASRDTALTNQITAVNSRVDDAESSITTEAQTRATKDTALTNQITAVNSRVDDAESSITTEAQTRASKDNALTSQINSANSRIDDAESSITTEAQTRATKDSALGTRIDAVVSSVGDVSSSVSTEAAARASADNALGLRIDNVESSAGDAAAAVQEQLVTAVAGTSLVQDGMFLYGKDKWSGTSHIAMATRDLQGGGFHQTIPATHCAVFNDANQGTTRHVTAYFEEIVGGDEFSCSMWYARMDAANGELRLTVQFYNDDNELQSWLTVEEVSLASEPSWTWKKMVGRKVTSPLTASKARVVVTLGSDNTQGRAAFTAVKAFRTDSILAESISTVQTQLGNDIASVQTTATTQFNSLDNRLSAKWGVVLDNNGYVSGWGQENDGNTSTTIFRTDRLAVAQPGKGSEYIFAIDGGKTVMKDALIGNLAFTKLTDSTGSFIVKNGKVQAEYIEADQLRVNYAKMYNINVETGDIKNLAVSTLKIQDQAVNFPTGSQSGGQSNIITINRNNATFVMDHYHNSSGANAMITVAGCVREITKGLTANMAIEVYINSDLTHSSPIGTTSGVSGDSQPSSFNFNLTLNRTLPGGSPRIWYKLRHIAGMSESRAEVLYRGIYVVEMKK